MKRMNTCFYILLLNDRLVDYLDEPGPGLFRQAQVSFSSLIPGAVPVCDAITMEPHLWLYCDYGRQSISTLLDPEDVGASDPLEPGTSERLPAYTADAMGKNSSGRSDNMLTPNVLMLTKHTNGSLNLWQVCILRKFVFLLIPLIYFHVTPGMLPNACITKGLLPLNVATGIYSLMFPSDT
jgi:hypothetical protein